MSVFSKNRMRVFWCGICFVCSCVLVFSYLRSHESIKAYANIAGATAYVAMAVDGDKKYRPMWLRVATGCVIVTFLVLVFRGWFGA
jgi:hypothetical protein